MNLARQEPRNDAITAEVALAHSRLGDIDRLLEMHEDAVKEYNAAISQFGKLARDQPKRAEYRESLAYCHNWLGETFRDSLKKKQKLPQYSAADAEREYNAAQALLQELSSGAPDNSAYRQELARSYYNRGILRYDSGSLDLAQTDFDQAVALLQPLASGKPPSAGDSRSYPLPSQDLARVYNNVGNLYRARKQFVRAAKAFEEAIHILEPLRNADPDNREYKKEIAQFYNDLALALADLQELGKASELNHRALDLFDELAKPSSSLGTARAPVLGLRDWISERERTWTGRQSIPCASQSEDSMKRAISLLLLATVMPSLAPGSGQSKRDHRRVAAAAGRELPGVASPWLGGSGADVASRKGAAAATSQPALPAEAHPDKPKPPPPKTEPDKPKPRTDADRPPIEGSMVGYVDDAIVGSRLRVRVDAGYHMDVPDRAEFFYPQCSCNGPGVPGPDFPGASTNVDFQQAYLQGEYAPVGRFSMFAEIPFRWIEPHPPFIDGSFEKEKDELPNSATRSGISDIRAGLKLALAASTNHSLTLQLRTYFPSGDGSRGLGTHHYSIEPSLLYHQRLSQRWAVEYQIGDWVPIGGSMGLAFGAPALSKFAGNVLFYGLGPSYQLVRGAHIKSHRSWSWSIGKSSEASRRQTPSLWSVARMTPRMAVRATPAAPTS